MSETRGLARLRWLALIACVGLIAAACSSRSDSSQEEAGETSLSTEAPSTTRPPATTTAVTEPVEVEPPGPTGTLTYAILQDLPTDNYWAGLDTEDNFSVDYVLGHTAPSLYTEAFPNYTLVPSMAATAEVPIGEADGEEWVIDVPIREGLEWSDGEALDANDVAFTVTTAISLKLGGDFESMYPAAVEDDPETTEVDESADGIISAEAVDDLTVRFIWSRRPQLAEWHFGALQGAVFPEHFWAETVEGAETRSDLYAASGKGSPSAGPLIYDGREPGVFARAVANPNYLHRGSTNIAYDSGGFEHTGGDGFSYTVGDTSGSVLAEWTEGPFYGEVIYSVYEDADAAVLALIEGEVDYLLGASSLERGLRSLVLEAGTLDVIANSAHAIRYLSFNTRKFPMSDPAFRQAMACMIDKEFMANDVLQGAAIPVNSLVPPGNAFWANPDVSSWCENQTAKDRLASAVQILKDAGWTWDVEPQWNDDNRDVIPKGEGLRGPDGTSVGELELLAPGPSFDPLRATYALFIEDWAQDLGVPLKAEPTGFNAIVEEVFATGDAALEWDMYILGWSLTTYPFYLENFFTTANDSASGGFNTPGYSNPDYDALGEELLAEGDVNRAAEIVQEMDAIVAEDVPYLVLFAPQILETYQSELQFPSTETLDGIQHFGGLPGSVLPAD